MRSEQIVPWIAGQYQLNNGTAMEVAVQVRLVEHAGLAEAELAAAHTWASHSAGAAKIVEKPYPAGRDFVLP